MLANRRVLTECVAGWVQLCTSHSVSLNFIEHISPFAVRNFPRQGQIKALER